MPLYHQAQDHRIRQHVEQLLGHQCPDAVAPVRHGDADRRGAEGSAQRREKELPELHRPGYIRLVDVLHTRDDDLQAQHPEHQAQFLMLIQGGDRRGDHVQDPVHDHAPYHVEPEDAGKVEFVRVLFLDQGIPQAAVHKHVEHRDEHCHHGDQAVFLRQQDLGQRQFHQEFHALRAGAFCQAPQEVFDHGPGARPSRLAHFRILRSVSLILLNGPGTAVRIRSSVLHTRELSS